MRKTIHFMGLPGSGKTTCMQKINHPDIQCIDNNGITTDDLYCLHNNPYQNACILQLKLIENNCVHNIHKNSVENVTFVQHTPLKMIEFFTKLYRTKGYLSDYSFEYLVKKLNDLFLGEDKSGDKYIFLECSSCTLLKNIAGRNRKNENMTKQDIKHLISYMQKFSKLVPDTRKLILKYKPGYWHSDEVTKFCLC
jgi:deoxyadenosine/deoxycytidine kinase